MSVDLSHEIPSGHPNRKHRLKSVPALGAVVLVGLSLYASRAALLPAHDFASSQLAATGPKDGEKDSPTARAVAAAEKFLETLEPKQRDKVLLKFDAAKKKTGWSNLPVTMVARNGVPLGEMTKAQREAALDVLAALLSKEGYQKVIDIMNADDQLVKGGNQMKFGTDNYYLSIFGKPSKTDPWMVQFGGHHLGVNVTVVGKNSVLTPTHTGTQPASYLRGGKTIRPLGPENDLAFRLVNSLDEKQQGQAIIGAKPINLVLGPGVEGKQIKPQGIKGADLTEKQQATLLELIGQWVNIMNPDAAKDRMDEIKAKMADTYFAWSGLTKEGSAVYYRIQGPTLVIEYAPQGSTDHIHTIIRDPGNDYGQKLLKD